VSDSEPDVDQLPQQIYTSGGFGGTNIYESNTYLSVLPSVPFFRSVLGDEYSPKFQSPEPGPSALPTISPSVTLMPHKQQLAKKSCTRTVDFPSHLLDEELTKFQGELMTIIFDKPLDNRKLLLNFSFQTVSNNNRVLIMVMAVRHNKILLVK